MKNITGTLYVLCEWAMKLAYANLVWLLFSLCGAVLFGVIPATAALFSVLGKWLKGEDDFRVLPVFWQVYRNHFLRLNGFGLLWGLIGFFLYLDVRFLTNHDGFAATAMQLAVYVVLLLYLVTTLYFFPVYTAFRLTVFQSVKVSLVFGLSHVMSTLAMVGGTAMFFLFFYFFPYFSGMIVLFGASLPAFIIQSAARRVLANVPLASERE
ncbi:MAG TPA: DUF624 domain-containing protein [Bacillales bacterium]|nr:DUF624 domain-containing protein [Bacillales bacterium]